MAYFLSVTSSLCSMGRVACCILATWIRKVCSSHKRLLPGLRRQDSSSSNQISGVIVNCWPSVISAANLGKANHLLQHYAIGSANFLNQLGKYLKLASDCLKNTLVGNSLQPKPVT